jgi:hypothetical protein
MPSTSKRASLLKMRQRINELTTTFDENNKKLDDFYAKVEKSHITSRASYLKKMHMMKVYLHKLSIQNHLNARIAHSEIELRKASLSNKMLAPFVLTTTQLKHFID